MIQKRIVMALALPVAAAVARFAATKLRASGRSSLADTIERVTATVSPQRSRRRGLFRR